MTPLPDPQPNPQVDKQQAWRALIALCVGLFMTLLDQSLVAVALPRIREDLDASLNQVVWVSAVYLLAFAVPLLVTGRLGDRFGQRSVYLVGMALFTAAALACAFAPTIEWLIALRAVQGLGGSLLNPQPLSIITRIFPRARRGTAMGVWSAVASSAGLFGPVIGGVLVGTVGWRWVFAFYVPLGLVSLVLVARFVPRLPRSVGHIDLLSVVVSLIAVLGVVVALQQGPEFDWVWWIWAALATGLLAFVVFIRRQLHVGAGALVPPGLFRHRNFRLGIIAVSTLGFAVYSVNLPIMLYLQTGAGLSAASAGLMLVPMGVLSVILAPFAGRLTDRLAPGLLSKVGFGSLIVAMVLFGTFMHAGVPVGWFLLPVLLLGAANALAWSPNSAITMRDLPTSLAGAGSGVYNTSRQVGAVLGAAALGAVMQMGEGVTGFGAAMGNAMLVPVALLVVGLLAVSRFQADAPR
ncbi:DHA2 family efflux MFS transporter permease subunit [Corynebacterium suedekumii]|uniref:DHA2 family efflux MFS transporter permease subunit n=1 Tax=Corynebacterium suedekumii TaxID=3049801 RepID=A0ABY8VKY8_9CORY|nr:DHA2 family efflux MFS transporter permease subunit [Corynebacterium suedekumii]WIM69460.1 DHA2 family efflux MFS transporter permease subunit [Corynebacterium suedekumii]